MDLTPFDVLHQPGEDAVAEHGAAEQRQVLEIERAQIERHHGARDRAGHGVPSAGTEHLEQVRPGVAADHVDDHVEGIGTERVDQRCIAVHHRRGPRLQQFLMFGGCRHARDLRSPHGCQLHCGRAHTSRRTGDEHTFVTTDTCANHHVLGRRPRTRERRQLDVGERRDDRMCDRCRDGDELGERTVDLGPQEDGGPGRVDPTRLDEHPPAEQRRVGAGAHCGHLAARIDPLDARERERAAPTATRVPPDTGVDVGVVHPGCTHTHEHIIGSQARHRHVRTDDESIDVTVPDQLHCPHRRRRPDVHVVG